MNLWTRLSALLGNRKSSPLQDIVHTPTPRTKTERISTLLQKQSYPLYLALECNRPIHLPVPEELDDSSSASLFLSLLHYFENVYAETSQPAGPESARGYLPWIASALLLCGRLEMMEVILDNLTRASYQTDHYCGQCNLLPYFAISRALPIPPTICACSLASGRIDIQAARKWFHANRDRLEWSEKKDALSL